MKKLKLLFLTTSFMFTILLGNGQVPDKIYTPEIFPLEKLYLHLDRDFYFLRDNIWFNAYLLDGVTQKRLPGFRNMFVDLIDVKGETALTKMYIVVNGLSAGNLAITDSIKPGKYMIRAHSTFQDKLGEETFFYKPIYITKPSYWQKTQSEAGNAANSTKPIDLSILPEGGFALTGIPNTFAFKVVDNNGKGIIASGKIMDNNGNITTTFKTSYRGMGTFLFTPEKGKEYFALVDGHPEIKIPLKNIKTEGVKLSLENKDNEELILTISRKGGFRGQGFNLACLFRGNLIFNQRITLNANSKNIQINPKMLNGGINRFVVLNDNFEPLSERLFFFEKIEKNTINIKCNAEDFATRSLVQLDLTENDSVKAGNSSDLSIAVIRKDATVAGGEGMNILSWSLINSELLNFAEPSLNYFETDSLGTSKEKLDLLMLTNGWSNYIWNRKSAVQPDKTNNEIPGITISGYTKRLFNKEPLKNSTVVLGIFKSGKPTLLTNTTDENGRFKFEGIHFTDTAKVFLQVKNKQGKNAGEAFLDPIYAPNLKFPLNKMNWLKTSNDIPEKISKQKYIDDLAMKEFDPDYQTIMLGNINVFGKKKEDDEIEYSRGLYSMVDQKLEITDKDRNQPNVLLYLASHVAGLSLHNNSITFSRNITINDNEHATSPSFIIDGVHFQGEIGIDIVRSMTMRDIKRIDVIKNPIGLSASANSKGIIAIYTATGNGYNNIDFIKGTVVKSIEGYSPLREFYSPAYTLENINSPEPDRRTTLYWNPHLVTESGKASVSFFSADNLSEYEVFIEGITSQGKACLGKTTFKVSKTQGNN